MRRHPVVILVLLALAAVTIIAHSQTQKAQLSPRKQAETTIAGKKVIVDYGAPSVRGRKIMGDVVPYGKVWRTGANEATALTTETDLMVGGTRVAAGKYTLFTLPAENGWKLIINKQTGQWGTEYDEKQDLARVDMKVAKTQSPVEQMQINFTPAQGGGATMHLMWENTDASVVVSPAK